MKRLFNCHVTILIALSLLIGSQLAPAQDLPPEELDILLQEPFIPDDGVLNNISTGTEALVTEQMSQWEIFPICTDAENQSDPSVSGNIVVWHDYRNYLTTGWDIYGFDLSNPTAGEFPICMAAGFQQYPSVSGNVIVWSDYRNLSMTGEDIYGYDLSNPTAGEFPICDDTGSQRDPSVSGNIVVWSDYRNLMTGWDIYSYDLTTGQELPICIDAGDQRQPSVSGNVVVWTDSRNYSTTEWDIYGFDMSNPTTGAFPICTDEGFQLRPSVSGNVIVWEDYRNLSMAGMDIYGYDLTTKQEFPICTYAGDQLGSSVSGNVVVWHDNRNLTTGWDIYSYDLTTGQELPVCTYSESQAAPFVSGNTVVWSDRRSFSTNSWDIYGARLLAPVEMATQLLEAVESLNLDNGIDSNLDAKIDTAISAINDLNDNNNVATINSLQAFINAVEAQRGKKLSEEEADQLVDYANQIIERLESGANAAPSMIRSITTELLLSQNYPNPFNPDTWIPYRLPYDADVIIRIHDVTGRLIRILNLGYKPAGLYVSKSEAVHWDGTDEAGQAVPSGIYFYSIQAGEYTITKKMTISR